MLLWLVLAALTAGVVAALLRPWSASAPVIDDHREAGMAVYRDQLAEIEADLGRGLLTAGEAAAARTEVARRLLPLAAKDGGAGATAAASADRSVLNILAVTVPLASLALYLVLGSPQLPSQPHAERVAARSDQQKSVDDLIAKVEARLKAQPEDGRGWDVIAPIYMGMERYAEAASAYANANRLLGETAPRLAGFSQAEILANGGTVTPNARTAAGRLLALEPKRVDARLWLALAVEQDGKRDEALTRYREILSEPSLGPDAKAAIESRIAGLEGASGSAAAPERGAIPAPKAADAEAIQSMPPAEQAKFIEQMVARLAARLDANGQDADGWAQLIRSYMMMGRKAEAAAAWVKARAALAGQSAAVIGLDALAGGFGLELPGAAPQQGGVGAAKDKTP
jgi:cytochrome c-type biogenesis protein CcmH